MLIPASAIKLLRQALANGQSVRLKIISGSMDPLLRIGDTVIIEPIESENLPSLLGEIITFEINGDLFTHRLVRTDGKNFRTAADRSGLLDPELPLTAVLGHVIAFERKGTYIGLTSGPGYELSRRSFWWASKLTTIRTNWPPIFHRPASGLFRGIALARAFFY